MIHINLSIILYTYVEHSPTKTTHTMQVPLCVWRKALLLKYIGLPLPPFFLITFNFGQTVGEMVFVSFEVEKMRMFLVQSIVRWCWVLVRSWGAVVSFPV